MRETVPRMAREPKPHGVALVVMVVVVVTSMVVVMAAAATTTNPLTQPSDCGSRFFKLAERKKAEIECSVNE